MYVHVLFLDSNGNTGHLEASGSSCGSKRSPKFTSSSQCTCLVLSLQVPCSSQVFRRHSTTSPSPSGRSPASSSSLPFCVFPYGSISFAWLLFPCLYELSFLFDVTPRLRVP